MLQIITPYDFLLLPIYLAFFYIIVRRKAKKYETLGLRRIFITAFWLRMAGAIFYGLLIQYYYGYGDTFGYYNGSNVITFLLQKDISSVRYFFASGPEIMAAARFAGYEGAIPVSMANDSNAFVMKITAIVSLVSFNKYLIIAICFGFFSFIGIWKLFYIFYKINQEKQLKLLAFFVLFFPSLWFWGSGLLKESICFGTLGISIYLIYKNFVKKDFSLFSVLILLDMLYVLTMVKNYITIIMFISFTFTVIYFLIGTIRNIFFKSAVLIISSILIFIILDRINFDEIVKTFVDTAFRQIQVFQNSYQAQAGDENSGTVFSTSSVAPTLAGMLINAPAVIGSCLFRPFPWEARKIIIFLSSLEALFTFYITIYILFKTRIYNFFKLVFTKPSLLFCFIFSILFALLIGYTTFNFGTLVRYKIIFLPFYFFMLIKIYTLNKEKINKNLNY